MRGQPVAIATYGSRTRVPVELLGSVAALPTASRLAAGIIA